MTNHAETSRPVEPDNAHQTTTARPEPIVRATTYTVNCVPGDGLDSHDFALTVEHRGGDNWAVKRGIFCLGADGAWGYEMQPSSREDDWLATHRFDLDTALMLAKDAAWHVTVGGHTVADALRQAAAVAGSAV